MDEEVRWGRLKTYEVVKVRGPVTGPAASGQAEPGGVGQLLLGWVDGCGPWLRPPARREIEAERSDCGVDVPRHPSCDAATAGLSSALMWSGPAHNPKVQQIPG